MRSDHEWLEELRLIANYPISCEQADAVEGWNAHKFACYASRLADPGRSPTQARLASSGTMLPRSLGFLGDQLSEVTSIILAQSMLDPVGAPRLIKSPRGGDDQSSGAHSVRMRRATFRRELAEQSRGG